MTVVRTAPLAIVVADRRHAARRSCLMCTPRAVNPSLWDMSISIFPIWRLMFISTVLVSQIVKCGWRSLRRASIVSINAIRSMRIKYCTGLSVLGPPQVNTNKAARILLPYPERTLDGALVRHPAQQGLGPIPPQDRSSSSQVSFLALIAAFCCPSAAMPHGRMMHLRGRHT